MRMANKQNHKENEHGDKRNGTRFCNPPRRKPWLQFIAGINSGKDIKKILCKSISCNIKITQQCNVNWKKKNWDLDVIVPNVFVNFPKLGDVYSHFHNFPR